MKASNTYLYFNGNCREAMSFYRSVFGAEADFTTFGDMPVDARPGDVPDDGIMHCELHVPGFILMAGDHPAATKCCIGDNFAISLTCDSPEEMDRLFDKLSEGREVATPIRDAFWGDRIGVLSDRFGISWMLSFR